MRTTLTLDEDVAALLAKENRQADEPMKQTVNRLLRAGLNQARSGSPEKPCLAGRHPSWLKPVGIPMLTIYAFLRVVTDPKGINALSFQRAAEIIDSWLEPAHVRILYPGDRHWFILRDLAGLVRLAGRQVTDAAIAAIAIEHGATVYSNDIHFARFPNVRWSNPLKL